MAGMFQIRPEGKLPTLANVNLVNAAIENTSRKASTKKKKKKARMSTDDMVDKYMDSIENTPMPYTDYRRY